MTSVLKKIFTSLFVVAVLAGSAQATQYPMARGIGFPEWEVGDYIHLYSSGTTPAQIPDCNCGFEPETNHYWVFDSLHTTSCGPPWTQFSKGNFTLYGCSAPPTGEVAFHVIEQLSDRCWLLETCETE